MVVQAKVQKWGNSYGIRLQKLILAQLNLKAGSMVDLDIAEGKMIVTPTKPEYTLEELVSKITPENLHGETSTGTPAGAEVW